MKIGNFLLGKMIQTKLTSKEIDFMLFIFPLQDNNGNVCGLYYKKLCKCMHMSFQGFYNVMRSLERKGIISCSKSNRMDYDIKILDNSFRNEEDRKDGYIPANYNILHDDEFYKLKAGAKLLALQILKISGAGKGEYEIGTDKFYVKYTEMFGVSKRVMRTYLMQLKPFFSIGIKNGKYYMRPKVDICKRDKVQRESFAEHTVDSICRRNRIKEMDLKEKREVGQLIWQYEGVAAKLGKSLTEVTDALRAAAEKCIEILNDGQKRAKKRILDIKLIHTLLREGLGILPEDETSERMSDSGERVEPKSKNKFNNFPQRQYDYEQLEKYLLNGNIVSE